MEDADIPLTAEEQGVANIASALLHRYDELPASDDEFDERSDEEDHLDPPEPIVTDVPQSEPEGGQPRKRARTRVDEETSSRYWFPWRDRITCNLDSLMHLPRSVFSHRQLDLFLWLLKVNQVDDVPSVKSMQSLNATLQKMCGIDSILYNGALGHKYYVNSLSQIIAQEMANPKVRPHLSFYPEDSGPKLSEARQGDRWLKEIPDSQTTPMLRIAGQDYFIHEPAMLRNGDCCIPTRWFTKNGEFFAKCWALQAVCKDELSGWRAIIKSEAYIVPASEFLKNFPDFRSDVESNFYNTPHPTNIFDVYDDTTKVTSPWTHTDPKLGNPWRAKANGSRVWNEHNSFLVTPAGLPREESQKEYNIHFLSTSNIAPPLEMMDGIVEQLDEAQENRIWAWDVVFNEPVLVIPDVLALLGDNPMQSEFACHIGLRSKLFCRACWVKGSDALDDTVASNPGRDRERGDEADSDSGIRRKVKETLAQMVQRVKAFVKIGRPHNKAETTEKLKSYFTDASTLDTKTKVQKQRTESGLKDTYQLFFLEKLFDLYKGKRGREAKQAALDAQVATLPKITTSPVWGIKGLDPHMDTPVEILHVVLLGFVKYLWQDLVQLQLKTKEDKKDFLITRLSSLDVSGLGISPLAGRTLVKYSGSLTGRDFRFIAQVAPFVLYDLVSSECFETWQALSKLIPLIWQPEILDIEPYTHIRRFEAFESFNAIIRGKTLAFAQGNRIRHLLSGGLFLLNQSSSNSETPSPKFSANKNLWKSIGPGPKHLVESPNTVTSYLWINHKQIPAYGMSYSRPIHETLTGQHTQQFSNVPGTFRTCRNLTLNNGDVCIPGSFVIVQPQDRVGETIVGCVDEIIQHVGSVNSHASLPDGVLIRKGILLRGRPRYGMPSVITSGEWQLCQIDALLCTVNVQHNCMDNNCGPTASQPVYQERQRTNQTRAQIAHLNNPTDFVLNTAQMRDAKHLQRFRINTPILDEEIVIHQSAVNELEANKQAAASTRVLFICFQSLVCKI
ncbi:hypothetical protein K438DRAFT_1908238 [Mycena galopus ATCC 62051]|nr:hypothetical protein K438DRAFT_1908238 [Mycena galopus ATCC 62051]